MTILIFAHCTQTNNPNPLHTFYISHCTFCNRDGHTRDGCFKRIGYPEWLLEKGKREDGKFKAACVERGSGPIPGMSKEQSDMFLKHFAEEGDETIPRANNTGKIDEDTYEWVIDSGTT